MDWASRLKERVTLQAPVASSDGQGGQSVAWNDVATLWAEVRVVGAGSRERANAQQPQAAAGYRVRIRTHAEIDATMRLQWRTRTLAIHSVHEHDAMLELLAYEEGV